MNRQETQVELQKLKQVQLLLTEDDCITRAVNDKILQLEIELDPWYPAKELLKTADPILKGYVQHLSDDVQNHRKRINEILDKLTATEDLCILPETDKGGLGALSLDLKETNYARISHNISVRTLKTLFRDLVIHNQYDQITGSQK